MGVEDQNIKPTLSEPTPAAVKLNKDMTTALVKRGVNPHVIKEDSKLADKDKTLKSQIFDLQKMEAMVYSDPKLTAVYDKLAETGKETYGYHWNETLMNILFNDYVLHSPKYLMKYKQAQPEEKDRRDASGKKKIRAKIRKKEGLPDEEPQPAEPAVAEEGFDIQRDGVNRTEKFYDTMEEPIKDNVEETTGAASAGAFTPKLESEEKLDETTTSASSGQYSTPVAWSKNGKPRAQKPLWHGGQILESAKKDGNYLTDPAAFKAYFNALNENDEPMMGQMEGLTSPNDDSRVPIAELSLFGDVTSVNDQIGDILHSNKPLYDRLRQLPAGSSNEGLVKNFIQLANTVQQMGGVKKLLANSEDERYVNFIIAMLATYSVIRERGLDKTPEVAKAMKSIKTIIDPALMRSMGESEQIQEHHLNTREEKVQFILQNQDKLFKGVPVPNFAQDVTKLSDAEIEALYTAVEKVTGMIPSQQPAAPANNDAQHRETLKGMGIGAKDANAMLRTKLGTPNYKKQMDKLFNHMNGDEMGESAVVEDSTPQTMSRVEKIIEIIGIDTFLDNILRQLKDDTANKILGQIEHDHQIMDETVIPTTYTRMDTIKDTIGAEELLMNIIKKLDVRDAEAILSDIERHFQINDEPVEESMIDQQDPSMVNGNPTSMVKPDMGGDPVASASTPPQMGESKITDFGKAKNNPHGVQGDNTFTKGVNKPNVSIKMKKDDNKLKNFGDAKTDANEKANNDKVNKPIVDLKESLAKELDFYSKHLSALNDMMSEERRPSALVMLDRLKKDNEENFEADLKNNNIEDEVEMQDELFAEDLNTEVGDNPYKLGQDIEKKSLEKTNGGKALENVGDSTNDKGDEIPKRNLTKEEMLAVAMNRGKGLQDIVYDNKPSERFEKRMQADLGDDIYKLRKQKMEYEANAPMYNKDTQPNEKGEKAVQYDKDRKGYNSSSGLGESISAKYTDSLGKTRFVDFKLTEAKEIENVDNTFTKLSTDGMGNSYTMKVNENTSYSDFASKYDLYLKEGVVYTVVKKQSLNESTETKSKNPFNMSKINHLINYKTSTFVDSKKSSKNIK